MPTQHDEETENVLDELGFTGEEDAQQAEERDEENDDLDLDALDDGQDADPAQAAADAPEGEPDGDEPAPTEPAEGAQPPEGRADGQPSAPAGEAPDDGAQPFRYRADGRDFDVPNAVVFEDEVPGRGRIPVLVMPLDEFQRHIQPNLRDRRTVAAEVADLQRQLAERDPEVNPVVLRNNRLSEFFDNLAFNEDLSDEDILEAIHDLRERRPVWEAEQRAAAAEARLAARESVPERTPEDDAALYQTLETGLRGVVDQLAREPDYAGVSAQKVADQLMELGPNAFWVAEEDDPARGILRGEIRVRDDLVRNWLTREAAEVKRLREGWQQVQQVKQRNERALGNGRNTPHPAPLVGGSPQPGGPVKEPETREEWEASLRALTPSS